MRLFLIAFFILFFSSYGFCDYYVVDIDNNVVSKTKYKPSQNDLDTRNEIAVQSLDDIDLTEAEYRNGKIVKHTKTADEIKEEKDREEKNDELDMIRKRTQKDTYEKLKSEGVVFKHVTESDFE